MADQITAYGRVTSEARRVLSSREVEKTLIIAPRTAAPPATAAHRGRPVATNVEESEHQIRNALYAREIWEREVVTQFAAVELQTNILIPLISGIVGAERNARTAIRLEESQRLNEIESSAEGILTRRDRCHTQKLFVRRCAPPSAPAPSDARAASAPLHGARPTSITDPAMEILDRYISSRQQRPGVSPASLIPAPPGANLNGAPARLFLDLATSVHLQNQYTYFRRGIDAAEADERHEIDRQLKSQAEHLIEVVRRRQHLERLVYWREERDAKRVANEVLEAIADQISEMFAEELSRRKFLAIEAETESASLWSAEYLSYCVVELNDMERFEVLARVDIVESFHTESALRLVPAVEELERTVLEAAYEDKCKRLWWPTLGDLRQLHVFSQHVRASCVTIQRFFRKRQIGVAGWRKTHRSVGEWVLQHRALKRHSATQRSLINYSKALEAEVQAILQEAEQERVDRQQTICAEERTARLNAETEDQWFRSGFNRRFRTEWIHDIILPQFGRLEQLEERARQELFEVEVDAEKLSKWHNGEVALVQAKRMCMQCESLDRLVALTEEQTMFDSLLASAWTSMGTVQERQRNHLAAQGNERISLANSFEDLLQQTSDEEQREMLDLYFLFQRSMMEFYATSSRFSGRLTIYNTWTAGVLELWSQFLLWEHAMFGRHLKDTRRFELVDFAADHFTGVAAIEKRELVSLGPRADFLADMQTACAAGRDEIEKRVEQRFRSVKSIQAFYRNYTLGKVGRTGLRAHLRAAFAEKRETAELRQKMASQRNDIAQSKKELEDEIARYNLESYSEYCELIGRIENNVEPRRRNVLSTEEAFIVRIMKHNFSSETVEIIKRNLSELFQHESFGRTKIFLEWKCEHTENISRRQLVFENDVKIRPAQRAWRCFIARRTRRLLAGKQCQLIPTFEASARFAVQIAELSAYALDIAKPSAAYQLSQDHVHNYLLGDAIWSEAFGHCAQVIFQQELAERVGLLWMAQQRLRYGNIEESERRDRSALRDLLNSSHNCMAVVENEIQERSSLTTERDLLLQRVLAKIEALQRIAVNLTFTTTLNSWVAAAESLNRLHIMTEHSLQLRWPLEHYEANQRINIELVQQWWKALLSLEFSESESRVYAEDRMQSTQNWYLWLIGVQESRQRAMLETERRSFLASVNISFVETKERFGIWQTWLTQLEHPAHFAAGAVIVKSPPFLYACVRQEEDLRTRTLARVDLGEFWSDLAQQKEYVFATYLNLRLH